ncbi:acyltransferase [Methylomonas koyamae]|uniref:acyltransferase n=1 Tax=Methylomonas koyamae TaxID=702114 RepID=UPI0006D15DF8|nr:hypothetical protein [Methylomonas koyamae]
MRQINGLQILIFFLLLATGILLTSLGVWLLIRQGIHDTFLLTGLFIGLFYLAMIGIFRIFQYFAPLTRGEICENSIDEFIYHVYILFFLLIFYPVMRSGIIPVPFMRLFYKALGAKMGKNSYASGIIFDPQFVQMGDNCLIGQNALLVPHNLEGKSIGHDFITLGNHVTVGANAVVMSGVNIEDYGVVAVSAVVKRGTLIKKGEIWGGVPAVCIRRADFNR